MGNSEHGTKCMRVGGDDGELRPWHYKYASMLYTYIQCVWSPPTLTTHTHHPRVPRHGHAWGHMTTFLVPSLLLSSLELSDIKVYEP